jgi:hypothetical protein
MKYKVITNSNTEAFQDEVNKSIADGWKPLGGINSQSIGLCSSLN